MRTAVLVALIAVTVGCSETASVPPPTLPPPTPTAAATTTPAPVPPSTIERHARGVLMTTLTGTALAERERDHLQRGGRAIILFAPNISDAGQLTDLTGAVSCAAAQPILVAVDQELGEPVRRLTDGMVTPLPTPEEAVTMPLDAVEDAAARLGREMINLGVNVTLAPVIDVVTGVNPVLVGRHLGDDPEVTAAVGAAFVTGLASVEVVAVPKHFPGHGRTTTDPHDEPAVVDATERDLQFTDWPPFQAAIDAGAAAIMVGHPVYTAIDAAMPASLSAPMYRVLRDRFGFQGVAVTDALGMAALADIGSPGDLAVLALEAGADLLVFEDPAVVDDVVLAIVTAVLDGSLDRERLAEAAARVDTLASSAAPVRCS